MTHAFYGYAFASTCIDWSGKHIPPIFPKSLPIVGEKPNVLLVNNIYDSNTSLEWAKAVNQYLELIKIPHKLITWSGPGHIAYHVSTPENGCIDQNIDNFLLTGQLPNIVHCDDDTNPFLRSTSANKTVKIKGNLILLSF